MSSIRRTICAGVAVASLLGLTQLDAMAHLINNLYCVRPYEAKISYCPDGSEIGDPCDALIAWGGCTYSSEAWCDDTRYDVVWVTLRTGGECEPVGLLVCTNYTGSTTYRYPSTCTGSL